MSGKRILLTGTAGFIGSVTCKLLLAEGYSVVGIDNLNDYYDPRLKQHRLSSLLGDPNFTFIEGDIEDLGLLKQLFTSHSFDAVVNLAARAGVGYSLVDPEVYLTTNILGTLNLLQCMQLFGVTKLVHASTSSLYAGQPMPFSEELPVNTPFSPYAATKKSSEMLCYTWHHLYGIDVSIVRYFTVFGPAGRPDMSIFRFARGIIEETPITVTGDGTQSRDFTYVDDIARGTVLALKPLGFKVINLGGGRTPSSINDLVAFIEARTGKKAILLHAPMAREDMVSTWAEIGRAADLLGWSPQVTLEEGLDLTMDWHLANRDFVASCRP